MAFSSAFKRGGATASLVALLLALMVGPQLRAAEAQTPQRYNLAIPGWAAILLPAESGQVRLEVLLLMMM